MKGIFYACSVIVVLSTAVNGDLITCPETGLSFHAHPYSCSQFLECRDGVETVIDCTEGLHFDPGLGFCFSPEFVGCSIEDNVQEEENAEIASCPASGQVFLPHPTSCSQFIECNYGEARIVDCIGGLHFNPNLGWCDLPENVGCEIEIGGDGNDSSDEAGEGGNSDNEEDIGVDIDDGEVDVEGDNGVEGDGEGNDGEVDVEGDNSVEGDGEGDNDGEVDIEGDNGVEGDGEGDNDGEIDVEGDNGVEGDGEEDNDGEVDVGGDNGVEGDGESGNDGEVDVEGDNGVEGDGEGDNGGEVGSGEDNVEEGNGDGDGETGGEGEVDEDSGSSSEVSSSEDDSSDDVDGDNDEENVEKDSSETESDGDQDNEGDGVCPATGQHFFPHPEFCTQFIECNNGVYTVVDCFNGFHFNSALGWCDFPENVDCVDSPIVPTTTEAPSDQNDDDDEGGPVGECPPENGQFVHFLTDSRDCGVFYKCNWGVPVLTRCAGILHFNPTLNVCDWPENAGCTVG